jgi:uncharacterized protein (TIGR02594 family)
MTAPWIDTARSYLGTKEYPGAKSNPIILGFWKLARLSGIKDDAVPWCSGFACAMFEANGIASPHSDSARSWLAWGIPLDAPVLGCVVVFQRPGGYHVGFVVGQDKAGRLMVLGGNQGDAVSIAAFSRDRVVGYRYPISGIATRSTDPLPVLAGIAASTSEA